MPALDYGTDAETRRAKLARRASNALLAVLVGSFAGALLSLLAVLDAGRVDAMFGAVRPGMARCAVDDALPWTRSCSITPAELTTAPWGTHMLTTCPTVATWVRYHPPLAVLRQLLVGYDAAGRAVVVFDETD